MADDLLKTVRKKLDSSVLAKALQELELRRIRKKRLGNYVAGQIKKQGTGVMTESDVQRIKEKLPKLY